MRVVHHFLRFSKFERQHRKDLIKKTFLKFEAPKSQILNRGAVCSVMEDQSVDPQVKLSSDTLETVLKARPITPVETPTLDIPSVENEHDRFVRSTLRELHFLASLSNQEQFDRTSHGRKPAEMRKNAYNFAGNSSKKRSQSSSPHSVGDASTGGSSVKGFGVADPLDIFDDIELQDLDDYEYSRTKSKPPAFEKKPKRASVSSIRASLFNSRGSTLGKLDENRDWQKAFETLRQRFRTARYSHFKEICYLRERLPKEVLEEIPKNVRWDQEIL